MAAVQARGALQCGVVEGVTGFSTLSDRGEWSGLDVDLCRALATAIFNDPAKVKFVPLANKDRFAALQSGDIDVLARNAAWTISRDIVLGLEFPAITYFDQQGFLVRKSIKVNSALELSGATVCVRSGTTAAAPASSGRKATACQPPAAGLAPGSAAGVGAVGAIAGASAGSLFSAVG